MVSSSNDYNSSWSRVEGSSGYKASDKAFKELTNGSSSVNSVLSPSSSPTSLSTSSLASLTIPSTASTASADSPSSIFSLASSAFYYADSETLTLGYSDSTF